MKRKLVELAHARSGDKGDTANIGLTAVNKLSSTLAASSTISSLTPE